MPKVPLAQRDTASFDASVYYVPPPGRGTVSRPITLRVNPELADSFEALMHARPDSGDEPYFTRSLFRSISDIYRACLLQGFLHFTNILRHQELDKSGDILVASQRSAAEAHKMEAIRKTAEQVDASLRQYLAVGAREEAEKLWSEQWAYSRQLEGYAQKVLQAALNKHPELVDTRLKAEGKAEGKTHSALVGDTIVIGSAQYVGQRMALPTRPSKVVRVQNRTLTLPKKKA